MIPVMSLFKNGRHYYSKDTVHTAAGESVKIRSGRPANDAVERFVDALTIEGLVLYLKEPKKETSIFILCRLITSRV